MTSATPARHDKSAPVLDPSTAPPLRWGILGAGGIAHTFAHAVQHRTAATIAAVGSRSLAKAQGFAADFGVSHVFSSYEDLVASDEVDAIYVATPHSHHHEHALLALGAGKPVLVEKAFTRNLAEAQEIFDAADARGLFVMEAMWTRFLPTTAAVHEVVASGVVGEVVSVIADHGQKLDADPAGRLLAPELAGGSLLDLGVYPVSYAHDLLGVPAVVRAQGRLTQTGVDGQVAVVTQYEDPRQQAIAASTLWAKTATTAVVAGTKGWIELPGDFYATGDVIVHLPDGLTKDYTFDVSDGLAFEAAEVARCLAAGLTQSPRHPWQDTLEVMAIMDEVRRQVGVRYPGEAPSAPAVGRHSGV